MNEPKSYENPALACGLHQADGLLVAYLPPTSGEVYSEFTLADCTVYAVGRVVLDMIDAGTTKVKWWRVKEAARELKLAWVEPVWGGCVADFSQDVLQRMLLMPNEDGHSLHMRAYSHGPWIKLEDSKENEQA